MRAKFHGTILNLSENIAKSFRGGYFFLTHTVDEYVECSVMQFLCNVQRTAVAVSQSVAMSTLTANRMTVICVVLHRP